MDYSRTINHVRTRKAKANLTICQKVVTEDPREEDPLPTATFPAPIPFNPPFLWGVKCDACKKKKKKKKKKKSSKLHPQKNPRIKPTLTSGRKCWADWCRRWWWWWQWLRFFKVFRDPGSGRPVKSQCLLRFCHSKHTKTALFAGRKWRLGRKEKEIPIQSRFACFYCISGCEKIFTWFDFGPREIFSFFLQLIINFSYSNHFTSLLSFQKFTHL